MFFLCIITQIYTISKARMIRLEAGIGYGSSFSCGHGPIVHIDEYIDPDSNLIFR